MCAGKNLLRLDDRDRQNCAHRDDDQVDRLDRREAEKAGQGSECRSESLQSDHRRRGGPDVQVVEQPAQRRFDPRAAVERVSELYGDERQQCDRSCVCSLAMGL